MSTNITPAHRDAFEALTSGDYDNLALFSCFVNGQPASAIVAITPDDDGNTLNIHPLFVSLTPDMVLTDHVGVAA
ncbi:hypothetical protein [Rhodospira trueperi]|uniref:Uncharacterized protein n=1 Tax=Rhodospira trueperi TaxID=69960 RepID=A0A1G7IA17_9PROT|nr:hypothetical protein [Rhodospira trueperi]SDF09560.1 hypothetical protein SAMN05421720_1333 [Rhodospira trueperi]